jgi:putative oxidoreductase
MLKKLARTTPLSADLGLLVVRLWFGVVLALHHGYGKLMNLGAFTANVATKHIPLPWLLGPLAGLGEFFGGLMLAFGIFGRVGAAWVLGVMMVAAFQVHGADPFGKKELALAYGAVALALLVAGPGRFSVDARWLGRR